MSNIADIELADAIVEEMIDEVFEPRKAATPITGGGHQAPFDGELLGKYIRFVILNEVLDRLKGRTGPGERRLQDEFNKRWEK